MPRNFSRTPVSYDVLLDLPSGRSEARVSDISVSGCFVETQLDAREGEALSLAIKFADDEWLILQAVVAFIIAEKGFGLQFIKLGGNEIMRLERAIIMNSGKPLDRDGAEDES